jgi:hypothetical protein
VVTGGGRRARLTLLVLAALGLDCSARQGGAVTPGNTLDSVHSSAGLAYDLRLAPSWELVAPDEVPLSDAPTASERLAARPRGGGPSPSTLIVAVTDYLAFYPADVADKNPWTLDELEREATSWLPLHQLPKDATSRARIFSHDSVWIEARAEQPDAPFVTLILFKEGRRRFELRCLSSERPADVPCAGAFGSLEIHPPPPLQPELHRVLHLREPGVGFSFDAPDDHWIAFGPRFGAGGRQQFWHWFNADRGEIDFGIVELPAETDPATLQNLMVSGIAGQSTAEGATVTSEPSTLDQLPCVHLSIDGKTISDIFILVRGKIAYAMSVGAPARDAGLIERARAGVHFTPLP